MKKLAAVALCGILVLSGCKAKEAVEDAAISSDLADKGTTELLEEASKDSYDPPADGRLNETQIAMYLKVRDHEKKIAQVAKKELTAHAKEAETKGEKSLGGLMDSFKAAGSFADLMTADIRAAKELGYNTAEYTWVKEQVLAASGASMTAKLAKASGAMMDQAYAQTRKQYDEAKDETTKKMLADMLANYDKSKQEMTVKQDPAVEYNVQLLSKHENALNALASELSKFEDEPGQAEQGLKEWQKTLDKAVTDAQKNAQQ